MSYVGFTECGYEYYGEDKSVLFSSDNTHIYLLDYVTKDFSELTGLFEKYISDRLDITTFKPKDCRNRCDDLKKIIKKLRLIHPYFKYAYKDDFKNKIRNYFNELLVYTIKNQNSDLNAYASQKRWYSETLAYLMPPLFHVDEIFYDNSFHEFIDLIGDNPEEDEKNIFINNREKPIGFKDEIKTQKTIRNLLYFILDISEENNISKLKRHQRIWLYKNMFSNIKPIASVTQNLLLFPQTPSREEYDLFYKLYERYELSECYETYKHNDIHELPKLMDLDVEHDGIPDNIKDLFDSIIEYADKVNKTPIYETYEVKSLRELLFLEIVSMIRSGTKIKKCGNCGKYFTVTDKRKGYCNRIYEYGLPCSNIGPKKRFQKLMDEDPALAMYIRAYKTHHERIKYEKMSKHKFLLWCDMAKKKLEKARNGELGYEEFREWLKI